MGSGSRRRRRLRREKEAGPASAKAVVSEQEPGTSSPGSASSLRPPPPPTVAAAPPASSRRAVDTTHNDVSRDQPDVSLPPPSKRRRQTTAAPSISRPNLRSLAAAGSGRHGPLLRAVPMTATGRSTPSAASSSSEDVIPEIVVRTDEAEPEASDHAESSELDSQSSPPHDNTGLDDHIGEDSHPPPEQHMPVMADPSRPSLTSSMSAMSEDSELSSLLSSSVSSKATTPVDLDGTMDAAHPASASARTLTSTPPPPSVAEPPSHSRASPPGPEPQSAPLRPCPSPPPQMEQQPLLPPRPSKFRSKEGPRRRFDVRPKLSIPPDLTPQEYAMQCIVAAESSRLNPYALHQDEYLMLRDHICHAQITTYLNIRNGILRLWVRNPDVSVTREEAIGCAKDSRWFDVANVCFDWLVRDGFINFGCAEVRLPRKPHPSKSGVSQGQGVESTEAVATKRKTVVVIGAGLAGLGCARHLQTLFAQYSKRFREKGEQPPRVVVLEGRNRVGGRVYSRALKTKPGLGADTYPGKRYTAEMGGMIVTGFDRGNPINILVRGQLGLGYHALRADTTLYDTNGRPVDPVRDQLVEKLYNDCLDRVSEYKFKLPMPKLMEGKRDLIDDGKDSAAESYRTISYVEETTAAQPHALPVSEQNIAPRVDLVPVSSDRLTGRVHLEPGTPAAVRAAHKAKLMGWPLRAGVGDDQDIDLDLAARQTGATLGSVLDDAIMQYRGIVDINAQDMRLLNWHIANLEYSNAINLNQLSLKGWDIDMGNEWDGRHTMIIGGYQSLALGLAQYPTPLDIEYQREVRAIRLGGGERSKAGGRRPKLECEDESGPEPDLEHTEFTIECANGPSMHADYVVNTIPLGVLKHDKVEFQPPLPAWKTDAVGRLGYGVLNKVVLVYREPFWDEDRDIFGVLRQPEGGDHDNADGNDGEPRHPSDHSSRRGRFFQWFNVSNTSGMPVLLALMAGDAAFDTEKASDDDLVNEATEVLRSVFGPAVPPPAESIVTRWRSDRFARGSYSSAGPSMRLDDYDAMARPVGNHFFAGEHTSATHPATVHGAYLSGLRAASEVVGAILGPIEVPTPLIIPKDFFNSSLASSSASTKRGFSAAADQQASATPTNPDPRRDAWEAHEAKVDAHIRARLGEYPAAPPRLNTKAHHLFKAANVEAAHTKCMEGRKTAKAPPSAHEIRAMASKMWHAASEETRRPFVEQHKALKDSHALALVEFAAKTQEYHRRALELREEFERDNPPPSANEPRPPEAGTPAAASAPSGPATPIAAGKRAGGGGGDASLPSSATSESRRSSRRIAVAAIGSLPVSRYTDVDMVDV